MTLYARWRQALGRLPTQLTAWETGTGIALATVVGVAAGLGAVAFRELIAASQSLFFDGGERVFGALGEHYVIIIPAIGGLFVGLIIAFQWYRAMIVPSSWVF